MFKTFETFDRLEKNYMFLTEADEENRNDDGVEETPDDENITDEPTEDDDTGGDMPDEALDMDGGKPAPKTADDMQGGEQYQDPTKDPNAQANVETGSFVSSLTKAKYAELLVNAFTSPAVPKSSIPNEFLSPTTDNADKVIDFIANFETLNTDVATGDGSETAEALKEI